MSRPGATPATRGNRNWGYQLRLGLFEITERDFRVIAKAMGAEV